MEACYLFFLGKIITLAMFFWFGVKFLHEVGNIDPMFLDKVYWREKDSSLYIVITIIALMAFVGLMFFDPKPYWPGVIKDLFNF